MATATTTTVIDHTTDAGYNTWVAEIITMLFTTCGVTQTADTGQTNGTGLVRPAASTMNAYVVGRFNDTAQATNPIFFRLDFGTGGSATAPGIRLTVGTGSNGSGTINGITTLTAVGVSSSNVANSNAVAYVSRACYSSADGVLWLGWKYNGNGNASASMGGFAIFRSTDNTGAPTTDATMVITNTSAANSGGSSAGSGYMQVISHLTGVSYTAATGGTSWPNYYWNWIPFLWGSTVYLGQAQIAPCFQYTPVFGITPWVGVVLQAELGFGSTISATIVGSTPHTYINAGGFFGSGSSIGNQAWTAGTYGFILPWE